ncbi:MAG: hypothetical protein EBS05_02740 [Proteobacteria bacterium]|nr:hypothetical protein [Pseudomonadota bacterium]
MVGGITALGGGEYALADQISLRFVEAMARIAPTGAVVSLPMVQERMGVTRHRELEKRFSEEETLRPADLKVFSDLPGRSRYLLWVDARGNSSLNSHTYQVGRRQRYQDPISGVVWWGEPHLMQETFLTITDLSTTFVIWDLRTGETVWTCRISGTESLRERMTRPSGDARVDAAAGAHGTFEQMVERAVAALPP